MNVSVLCKGLSNAFEITVKGPLERENLVSVLNPYPEFIFLEDVNGSTYIFPTSEVIVIRVTP